jgi:hypothetical protein
MIAAVRSDTRAPRLTVEMSVAIDWGKNGAETSIVLWGLFDLSFS